MHKKKTRSAQAVQTTHSPLWILSGTLLLCLSNSAWADPVCPALPPLLELPEGTPDNDAPAKVSADSVQLLETGVSRLEGKARIEQPGRVLEAENIIVDRNKNTADAKGDARFQVEGLGLESQAAHYDFESQAGEFEDARYVVDPAGGRGTASRLATDGRGRATMEDIEYTTCPLGDDSWRISADQLEIDQNTGVATAKSTVVRFKNVPFLYAPWFSFPAFVDRKTGFLLPEFGNSSRTGFDLTAPYYFNLAPNYDATLYPRLLTKRGFQLGGEFRRLGAQSATELGAEFLPSDSEADDDRQRYRFNHYGLITQDWNFNLNYDKVSDKEYFRDLDTRLERTSRTLIDRHVTMDYQTPGGWLTIGALAQNFQVLDRDLAGADRPYERAPQINIDLRAPRYWLFQPALNTQYTRFTRDAGIEGDRYDVRPELALEFDNEAWFLRSQAAVRYTEYSLNNTAPGQEDNPTRTIPSYSLDTGLRFERMTGWGYQQTFTPRIYALHVPFENQDDIPIFDTGLPDFRVDELFEENRFTGRDRIADASQITVAFSSDLIDPSTGFTPVRATIGQIYRFDDPEIELPGTPEASRLEPNHSDLVSALDIRWTNDLSTKVLAQYDPRDSEMNRGSFSLRYRPGPERLINVAYRFRRSILHQTDLSFLWPVTSRWSAVGRWNYSLRDDQNIEILTGLQYKSCCWATRIGWRRFVADEIGEFNNAVFLQLELTGLASFGEGLERLIERDIIGFDPVYD